MSFQYTQNFLQYVIQPTAQNGISDNVGLEREIGTQESHTAKIQFTTVLNRKESEIYTIFLLGGQK